MIPGALNNAHKWPEAMDLRTAGQYLMVSISMIEQLLRERHFRAIQLHAGGDRRIRKTDLDAYLEQRTKEPVIVRSTKHLKKH